MVINGTMTAKACRAITCNEASNTINFNTAIAAYNYYREPMPLKCARVQFDLLYSITLYSSASCQYAAMCHNYVEVAIVLLQGCWKVSRSGTPIVLGP